VDTVVLFEKLAAAVGAELMVGVGENLSLTSSPRLKPGDS
jgi:hypothetical protein